MPPVVPNDLKNIPLLTVQSKLDGSEANDQERWVTKQLNVEGDQYVMMSNFDASAVAGVQNEVATTKAGVTLTPGYPNPASGTTDVHFTLPSAGHATLSLWNVRGQLVKTLASGSMEAGAHSVTLDASSLANGVYYYTLSSGSETVSNTLTVVH
ncbi:MAG TPA: T9SS type A sorting domain-containing protein [Candidatus Kapabacteria bacterium]|nr:T9SS type A sorting domain-containing protein [Candidatus Kapabacteria bacterium]